MAQDRIEAELAGRRAAMAEHIAGASKMVPLVVDGVRVCLDCGYPIDTARIAAQPQAVRCVECQSIYERRHR